MQTLVPFLPSLAGTLDFASVVAVAALLAGLGRLVAPSIIPEIQLMAGWGLLCAVLTLWGCLTPWDFAPPTLALLVLGGAGWLVRSGHDHRAPWRVGILTLPIWIVMLPVGPSQVDTWLNLLPNAAYLVDHGIFPRSDRPESYSFIPVAPYNTQFIAYAASLLRGSLVDNAMGSFNILLQCAAAAVLARLFGNGAKNIGWAAAAFGLLLAMPLNPGFIPRAFFAPYGEAPIAVTVMAAVWLISAKFTMDAALGPGRDTLIALALVLVALVNIKQSAIGMVLSLAAAIIAVGWRSPTRRNASLSILMSFVPALILYGVWRRYATESFAMGELKALPVSQWNFALIPQILGGVLHAISQKGVYFLAMAVVLIGGGVRLVRGDATRMDIVLALAAAAIVFDNGFILFTYVAHFEPSWAVQAHSYFRYMAQLSLLVMIGLVVLLGPPFSRLLGTCSATTRGRLEGVAIAAILAAPFIGLHYLRFDLEAPQPELARMVEAAKPVLRTDEPLAVLVPDDHDDIAGSYLRGLLLFEAPRLRFPSVATKDSVGAPMLAQLAAAGYRQAVLSCSDRGHGLGVLTPRALVVMRWSSAGWRALASWTYPVGLGRRHWAGLLPKSTFCGDPS